MTVRVWGWSEPSCGGCEDCDECLDRVLDAAEQRAEAARIEEWARWR